MAYSKNEQDMFIATRIVPTADNIANYIMRHDKTSVIITNEMNLTVISANLGYIEKCLDKNFLLNELIPAIRPIQTGEKEVGTVKEYEYIEEDEYEEEPEMEI